MTIKEAKLKISSLKSDIKLIRSLTNVGNSKDNLNWISKIQKEIDKLEELMYNGELEDEEDFGRM